MLRFTVFAIVLWTGSLLCPSHVFGQGRKPVRVKPPSFEPEAMNDVFVPDPASTLQGVMPASQAVLAAASPGKEAKPTESTEPSNDALAWSKLIAPTSIEDLVKASKQRLDQVVRNQASYNGGGFRTARQEFTLLAMLFAIIEVYDGDVRWKSSASVARERLSRAANNTKIGNTQTFNESKQRVLDIGDLMNGSSLSGAAREDVDWENMMDRAVLMRILKWAHEENLIKLAADESKFESNKEELKLYSDLVAALGKAALQEGMIDADDDEYRGYAIDMINQTRQIDVAIQTGDAGLARSAASKAGQSCQECHGVYN